MRVRKTDLDQAEQTAPNTTLVHFELPYLPANEVFLAGTFNDWHPAMFPMIESDDGSWQKNLQLAPGIYQYRFVVDGRWLSDPNNPHSIANPYGSLNSVAEVTL